MTKAAILIIDDEMQMRRLLEITLESNQYEVQSAMNAKEGLRMAATSPPDLIILDLGLPDQRGHDVLVTLREWFTRPIIILSVQSSEQDIILALDNGANDYLVKPFRTGELLARVRSALRMSSDGDNNMIITADHLSIDLGNRTITSNDAQVKLTVTEYKLVALFARHRGKVLTHQYLLREVWGPGYINQSQYLRVFISQLRKKIEKDPNRPAILITEAGVGYRFLAND